MWRRSARNVAAAAALMWCAAGTALSACPICFQVEDTGVTSGVRAAVVILGGITVPVLGAAIVFTRRVLRYESSQRQKSGRER